jgi:hypothetical protein
MEIVAEALLRRAAAPRRGCCSETIALARTWGQTVRLARQLEMAGTRPIGTAHPTLASRRVLAQSNRVRAPRDKLAASSA